MYYCVGLISEHKHPIVTMQFLNEWGDHQVVPHRIAHNSSVRVDGKNDTCTVYVCYHWYIYMQCVYMYMYVHMDSYMYNIIIVKVICNACIVQLVYTRDMCIYST